MMTINQNLMNFKEKIREKKYVLINSIGLLGIIAFLLLLANRSTFDALIGNHVQGMWLYHLGIFYPLHILIIATTLFLFYGLFIDQEILDKKLKIYSASYWKDATAEIYSVRKAIMINALQVLCFLSIQGVLTLSIAWLFKIDLISVMFFQVLATIFLFNIAPTRTYNILRTLPLTSINLSTLLYFLLMVFYSIKLFT